jgi:predicted extracellular nuclease
MEDPIAALKDAGCIDLATAYGGDTAYSYVFQGQFGYPDHAPMPGQVLPVIR